jgi:hypothetical protein
VDQFANKPQRPALPAFMELPWSYTPTRWAGR